MTVHTQCLPVSKHTAAPSVEEVAKVSLCVPGLVGLACISLVKCWSHSQSCWLLRMYRHHRQAPSPTRGGGGEQDHPARPWPGVAGVYPNGGGPCCCWGPLLCVAACGRCAQCSNSIFGGVRTLSKWACADVGGRTCKESSSTCLKLTMSACNFLHQSPSPQTEILCDLNKHITAGSTHHGLQVCWSGLSDNCSQRVYFQRRVSCVFNLSCLKCFC